MGKDKRATRDLVMMSVFIAIIIIQSLVPFLGFIPVGAMNATIIHVTVIIGTLVLGLKQGMGLGLAFALASMWVNTTSPKLVSFCFSPFVPGGDYRSLIVCMVPRVLIAVSSHYSYKLASKYASSKISYAIAGAAGSMTNTILVLGLIYFLFAKEYAEATNRAMSTLYSAIIAIIGTQGFLEAVVAAIISLAVVSTLKKIYK